MLSFGIVDLILVSKQHAANRKIVQDWCFTHHHGAPEGVSPIVMERQKVSCTWK